MSVKDDNRERVNKLVDAAEAKAYTICEACGVSNSTVTTAGDPQIMSADSTL